MSRNEHHIVHRNEGGWAVKRNGATRSSGIYNTKQDFAYFKAVLINAARELKIEIIAFCI